MVIKGNSSWEQINQGGSSGRPTDQRKILHTQYFMNNLAKSAIYYYFMPLLFSCYFIPLFLLLISPSLGCAFCRNSGGMREKAPAVPDRNRHPNVLSLYRGNEFAILRVFESQKSPFTTKIAG